MNSGSRCCKKINHKNTKLTRNIIHDNDSLRRIIIITKISPEITDHPSVISSTLHVRLRVICTEHTFWRTVDTKQRKSRSVWQNWYRFAIFWAQIYYILGSFSPDTILSENLHFISHVSERQTRGGITLLSIPINRSDFYKKSFTVTAIGTISLLT